MKYIYINTSFSYEGCTKYLCKDMYIGKIYRKKGCFL